jgi:hypothetical protein
LCLIKSGGFLDQMSSYWRLEKTLLYRISYNLCVNPLNRCVCLSQVTWGGKEYGPVFNDTFLSAVFKLQDQIQKVQCEWQPLMESFSLFLITTLITLFKKDKVIWTSKGVLAFKVERVPNWQWLSFGMLRRVVWLPLKCRSISTRLHGATSQKTAIFILVAVRTWNLRYQL